MHWTRRVGLLCLGLVSLGLSRVGFGQDPISATDGEVVYLDDFSGSVFLSPDGGNYLLFHKVVGEGVGHPDGYSRLGVRTRLWESFDQHVFGELHALVTDGGKVGFNAGGGYRWRRPGGIIGVHGWFDDYESQSENRYRQITTGVEFLHPAFDIRANGYIPIDDEENFLGLVDPGTDPFYYSNHIVTSGTGTFERVFHGWDLEGGGPVPLAQNWLRAYAGVYQLLDDGTATTGFRARAEARFMEGVNLNLMVSEDDKFGTNVNLGVEVRFRGTMPTRFQSGLLADRRYDQVRRVWPVQVRQELDEVLVPLTQPGTDDAITVAFVDNTADAGGDGTFENPFDSLPGSVPDTDLILVRRGSGVTSGKITLFDDQQLLGEGRQHYVDTDRLGLIPLPSDGFTPTGPAPTLGNGMGMNPIITLASNNVVSSFDLLGNRGIFGQNLTDFQVDNISSSSIMHGINIQNASGTGVLRDIDLNLAAGGSGVVVTNETGDPLSLTAEMIEVNGGQTGVLIDADGADINYVINGMTIRDTTGVGLALGANSADLTGTVDAVVVNATAGTGVEMLLDAATGTTTFNGLEANENQEDGIRIIAAMGSDYDVNILDSNLNGNLDDNVDADSVDMTSVLDLFIDPTFMNDAGDNAFEFAVANGATLNATLLDVELKDALNDAIQGMVSNNSTATLNVTNFDASGSMADGLDLLVSGGSTLTGVFTNTNLPTSSGFSQSGNSSVVTRATSGSTVDLTFTDILADEMAANGGVRLVAESGAGITSSWTGGSISNGLSTGVILDGTGAGTKINATFDNTAIDTNAGAGIDASLTLGDGDSELGLSLTNTTVTGNTLDGLTYALNGTGAVGPVSLGNQSIGTILLEDVDLSGNMEDAFQFDVSGAALLTAMTTAASTTTDFSGSGSNAFEGRVDGANAVAMIQIADAPADGSGEEGALLTNDNGGTLVFSYTNGTLASSGADGLSIAGDNGSDTGIVLDNVLLDGNGFGVGATSGDGLVATLDNAANLTLMLNDVSTSQNAEKGVSLTASNGSTIMSASNSGTLTSTMNAEEGLYFDINSGSTLTFNALQGSTSMNGSSGNFSGVRGLVDGTNSAASLSFANFTSDMNTQDGFEFDVTGGGMFIGELITDPTIAVSSASNNTGAGITLNASDANTVAAWVMTGGADVSGNMEDGLIVTATDIGQLAVQAVGTFDNNLGGYGIKVAATNVTSTAVEIGDGSLASVSGNFAGGVEIDLNQTTVEDISVTTLTQTENVESLQIDGFLIENNGGNGILVSGTDIDLTDGAVTNVNSNFNLGDGIGLFFDNSTVNGLNVANNGAQMNMNNGINLDLSNGSVADAVTIVDNVGAPQTLGLNFLVDGSVIGQPFVMTNISESGLNISNIIWDLSPLGSGPVFNTAGSGSMRFTPLNFSNFTTGLTTLNGVNPGLNNAIPDDSQLLAMGFNSFNSNESLEFSLGMSRFPGGSSTVFGDDLIGSTIQVDFANGAQITGTLDAVTGNDDAAMFNATTVTQVETGLLNNGGDGLRVHVDNSTLSNSTISNNIASDNGSRGIEILIENGSMVDLLEINSTVANNNLEEGVRLTLNNSTATDITIDSATVDDVDGPNGIAVYADQSTANSLTISNSVVQNSPNEGILVVGTSSSLVNLILDGNAVLDSLADGVRIDLTDTGVSGTLAINNSSIENSVGNGLSLNLDNSPVGRLEMSGNNAGTALAGGIIDIDFTNLIWTTSIDNNSSAGLDIASFTVDLRSTPRVWRSDQTPFNNRFEVTGNSGVITGLSAVNGVTVNPATNPLQDPTNNNAVLPEGGVPTGSRVVRFDFNDFDSGESFNYSLAHSLPNQGINGDITGAIGTVTLTDGRTASATALNSFGFNISQSFAQTFGGISSNGGNGVTLNAINGSNIGEIFIDSNLIQDNGLNGIEFTIADSTLPAVGSESVISNTTVGMSAAGDAFVMINPDTNGTAFQLDFIDNDFSGNAGNGINIALNSDSGNLTSNMSGNTISNNVGFGIRVDSTEASTVDLTIGDTAGNANAIDANENAGIALTLSGTGTSSLNLQNTTVSNTTAGTDANFAGEGIAVLLTDMAGLAGSAIGDAAIENTSFNGNAGHGIRILADLDSSITNLSMQNLSSSSNTLDGINILREGTAVVDNIVINNVTASDNQDGIDIVASLGNMTDEYLITNSELLSNRGRGISLEARIDGDIDATIMDSVISGNGNDGISITQVLGDMIDTPTVMLDVSGTEISANSGFGIDVQATHLLTVDTSMIDGNALGGINIAFAGLGTDSITNSSISGNGNLATGVGNGISNLVGVDSVISGNDILNNADNGISLRNGVHTINSNTIEMNGLSPNAANDDGDGIQLVSDENGGLTVIADDNMIRNNRGRGINLLVQGDTLADVSFTNGRVEGNMKEGVYVVTTTSLTRNVDQDANAANTDSGDLFANPTLVFNFDNVDVLSNGLDSGFAGSGLVMRIGTSGASTAANAYDDNGGFVSDGMGTTVANLTGRGGVLASITNSTFFANPGADVLIESFDSTVNPATTTGTWNAGTFNVTSYQQDPLARLDLNFTGNTGDDADVVRLGASYGNTENMFKSRTTAQTPAGPFDAGNRLRNAQRLADRSGLFSDPAMVVGDSADFLYSGVGGSTFRVTNTSDTTGFIGIADDFTDMLDAVQLGTGGTGELDFTYDLIP